MVTAQRWEEKGKEREVREAALHRDACCFAGMHRNTDHRNVRQLWEILQVLQGWISSWGREMRRNLSSHFLFIVSCLRELMPPKTLQQTQRKPSLTPWSWWLTQFHESGKGEMTTHKEIDKKASLGSWEGRWRFCPKGTATHPQIHPCLLSSTDHTTHMGPPLCPWETRMQKRENSCNGALDSGWRK